MTYPCVRVTQGVFTLQGTSAWPLHFYTLCANVNIIVRDINIVVVNHSPLIVILSSKLKMLLLLADIDYDISHPHLIGRIDQVHDHATRYISVTARARCNGVPS